MQAANGTMTARFSYFQEPNSKITKSYVPYFAEINGFVAVVG